MMNVRSKLTSDTLLHLSSIAVGTFIAVDLVPSDDLSRDALFMPAVIMTCALLLPIFAQLRVNLLGVLRVENVLMFGVVYWLLLDPLQSAYSYDSVNPDDLRTAFAVIGGFSLAIILGASGSGWPMPQIVTRAATLELDARLLFSAALLSFVLGMSKFAIACNFDLSLMIESLGRDRWSAPWARGDIGGAESFLDHMQYFGYLLPALCVMVAGRLGWINWRVITVLCLSLIMIAFLTQSGGRRTVGVVIGAALFTWIASRPQLRPTVLISSGLSLTLVLAFMQEMLRYRNVGFAAWWVGEEPQLDVSHLHVDDNLLRLAQLIYFYPERVSYVWFQTLYHAATLPIPRILWPGKPTGPGFDLPGLLGIQGVSLSSSVIGELWVSYGLVAVLAGGWVIGRMAGMWNKILMLPAGTGRPLMYGLGLMALFSGMRSVQALVQMSYIVLAWIAITAMLPSSGTGKDLLQAR